MGSEGAHSSRAEEAKLIKADKDRNWSPWVVDTADFEEEHSDKNVDFMTVQVRVRVRGRVRGRGRARVRARGRVRVRVGVG